MKSKYLFFILLILLIPGACSRSKILPLEGAWQWISIQYITGDTVKWAETANLPEQSGIKMWSAGHYLCLYRIKADTTYDYSYSGGSYKLEGSRYEETVFYHDMIKISDMVGLKEMMRMEIRNDTLIQTYPVDENGNLMKHYTIIEKYVRLD